MSLEVFKLGETICIPLLAYELLGDRATLYRLENCCSPYAVTGNGKALLCISYNHARMIFDQCIDSVTHCHANA